ncbi:MAG: metallophosphoesterase family protein [Desulfobacterales bacterium]|nr:metallophosphoesterase family protein [Desulfobacterales bacterium]MDX2509998.1 metallophosphoesterase family protein [Desulfobacterales bacterium]
MSQIIQTKNNFLVGVISDTHGLLQPAAIEVFKGTDLIIHAGDVGKPDILEDLQVIAPVEAVRGNMDVDNWARKLPETRLIEVGSVLLYVIHDVCKIDIKPAKAGISAIIHGHTHKSSSIEDHNGVLFLNPGSATQPRFNSPASVALLHVNEKSLVTQFIEF